MKKNTVEHENLQAAVRLILIAGCEVLICYFVASSDDVQLTNKYRDWKTEKIHQSHSQFIIHLAGPMCSEQSNLPSMVIAYSAQM